MPEAYRIAIAIAMTNGVSSVLKTIQKDLFGLQRQVDLTQGSFTRMKVAAVGAMAVVGGAAMLKGWADLAKAGSAITNQQGKMLQLGISYRDVMNETAVAMKVASQISGSTTDGNLAALIVLRSQVGGLKNANTALPAYAKAQFVLASNGYDPSQLDYFVKALDVQGAFVNKKTGQLDPAAFATGLQEAMAAVLTTGGLLTGQGFYQASRLSNPAGQSMGTEAYLKNMTEVLVALGNRGARGLEYAATDFIGGAMSKPQIAMLEKLHLLSSRDVKYAGGGRYVADTSKLKGADLLMKGDLIDWLKQYFLGAADAQGISALQAGSPFQQTLQSLISFLSTNWPQIQRSQEQQAQAQGTDQYSVAKKMYNGATKDFTSALTNLWHVLGVPAARQAVHVLRPLTDGIRQFTGLLGNHPEYAAAISKMLLGLGVGLTVLGGAAIVASIAAMVGTGGYLALAAAGISGLALALHSFPSVLKDAEKAIQTFLYDANHPFSAVVNASTAGGATGSRFIPRGQAGAAHSTINQDIGDAFNTLTNWINAGAPTNATVTNPRDISNAAVSRVTRALNAPSTGPSGTNLRSTPSGSAAHQQGPR